MSYPLPVEPIKSLPSIKASSKNLDVYEKLRRGQQFCFEGTYGTAMDFYSWVKKQVNAQCPISDYKSSRVNRDKLWGFSQQLLVRIKNHQIDLTKAPQVPWLKEFYPSNIDFLLPLADVLGINGAWQWFKNGVQFPGLGHRVHPYYGAYFPTRTEHLEMFDSWLQSKPNFEYAMDMGTGCGVLTFYMLKHSVKRIVATDINPNAILSTSNDLRRLGDKANVTLKCTSFFDDIDTSNLTLVVFNPPWIPDNPSNAIDLAMYYQPNFFDDFFSRAHASLPSGCTVLILFSTFAQAAGLELNHPIALELKSRPRFKLINHTQQKLNQKPSDRKHWLSDLRANERIELWELLKI
jgi:hypothetical protein